MRGRGAELMRGLGRRSPLLELGAVAIGRHKKSNTFYQSEKTAHTPHAHTIYVHKCVYLCHCEEVVYIYTTITGVGVEININYAQFMGSVLLAPLFAQLGIVTHAWLLQNIPFISS